MTFYEAAKKMMREGRPRFGVIVKNSEECRAFLDELERHMPAPQWDRTPLKEYAFSNNSPVVVVGTLYGSQTWDKWNDFRSVQDALKCAKELPGAIEWVLYTDITQDERPISDLSNILSAFGGGAN